MSLSSEPLRSLVTNKLLGNVESKSYEVGGILSLHEIDLDDELINPFPASNNVEYYLNIEELESNVIGLPPKRVDENGETIANAVLFSFEAEIYLGDIYFIEVRQRYNIWDLLGDVGGFHDGFYIVFSLFMGSYSALAFKVDFLKSTQVDAGSDQRT